MKKSDRQTLLSAWIKPSSDNEKVQQERALRMVEAAIAANSDLSAANLKVYAKGSYRNNTNVRLDSDVDIVVELQECFWYDFAPGIPKPHSTPSAYSGSWTRESWRASVLNALEKAFPGEVDSSGKVAINVAAKQGSRPSIDVVPSYQYRWYYENSTSSSVTGSCVWTKDLEQVVNWPQQQLDNGTAKNNATGNRYKNFVRALKNAENLLADSKVFDPMPSYFMECLIYNVDNASLQTGDLDAGFRATLVDLYGRLGDESNSRMLEPNDIKFVFDSSKWTVEMGKTLVEQTWKLLGYGESDG